jgi:hypothetical protein
MEVSLQTGLRRGDTVAFGHIRNLDLLDGADIKLGALTLKNRSCHARSCSSFTAATRIAILPWFFSDIGFRYL